jgi:hypothetical protein
MSYKKPGPIPGSEGAKRISEAHKGSHEHDKRGGFAASTDLARSAGRKGGEVVKAKYGAAHYKEIGAKGGNTVYQERGREFLSEIGRKGGINRGINAAARRALLPPAPPKRPVGRPRKVVAAPVRSNPDEFRQ